MNTINAFPLTWPSQFPRTRIREKGQFRSTLSSALKNVRHSLELFARDSEKELQDLIISSNVTLGVKPDDTGVAVWFTWDGMQVCIPVDRYSSVESNLQAIHHIIESRRVELRHGTLALIRATFHGFKSLPPLKVKNHGGRFWASMKMLLQKLLNYLSENWQANTTLTNLMVTHPE